MANLATTGISPRQLEGIVVTHEHSDHIQGVGALARRLKIPILASAATWEAMEPALGRLADTQKVIIERAFSLAGMTVHLIATSHDCRDGYGLKISGARSTLGVVTDTGMVTEEMDTYLEGCTAFIIEANHDLERLWNGKYPSALKRRVAGLSGHMSNAQAAEGLCRWVQNNTQRVVLAHLSLENNTPELAIKTICQALRESAVQQRCPHLKIRVAPRHNAHELIVLQEGEPA